MYGTHENLYPLGYFQKTHNFEIWKTERRFFLCEKFEGVFEYFEFGLKPRPPKTCNNRTKECFKDKNKHIYLQTTLSIVK